MNFTRPMIGTRPPVSLLLFYQCVGLFVGQANSCRFDHLAKVLTSTVAAGETDIIAFFIVAGN